jgi:uncharacterized protein
MKRFFSAIIMILWLSPALPQNILSRPNPPRLVTDEANLLSSHQVDILEEKLVALDDSTSNQIAVVTVTSLGGYEIEDYAVKLFRDWGIGDKTSRNGILILIAPNERRVRIEVGYGLEGAIPDITANDIIDNILTPRFKEGNFYAGIDNAVDALGDAATGEYYVARERQEVPEPSLLLVLLIILIVLMIIMRSNGGGRGGGMISRRGYRGWGGVPPIWTGGGGGWSGGGWSGGGGGFGGFGGGSSGGGGASGSW